MKVSFDGIRKNIARSYNEVVRCFVDESEQETEEALMELRQRLRALMACYDPEKQPEDFNDLDDIIILTSLRDDIDD